MKASSDDKPLTPEEAWDEVQGINREIHIMCIRLGKEPSYSVASRIQVLKRKRSEILKDHKPKLVTGKLNEEPTKGVEAQHRTHGDYRPAKVR